MSITLSAGETRELNVSLTPVYVPPQLATLWGYVTDARTGAAIAGAVVSLRAPSVMILDRFTDASGKYEFKTIPAGTYDWVVLAEGYETAYF